MLPACAAVRSLGSHEIYELRAGKRGSRLRWQDEQGERIFSKLIAHAKLDGFCWREATRAELETEKGASSENIRRAERIVVVVEQTEGVRWELERIIALGAVSKTLFFFHPKVRDPQEWGAAASMVRPILERAGLAPPDFAFQSRPLGFYFQGSALIEIVNAHWSATSYRTAFSHFLAEPFG